MMEPLGEEEERVLKEFEFDSGKLVGELGQDFEGLGALLGKLEGKEIHDLKVQLTSTAEKEQDYLNQLLTLKTDLEQKANELESLKEKMAKTSEEIKSKLDEREENMKNLKKQVENKTKCIEELQQENKVLKKENYCRKQEKPVFMKGRVKSSDGNIVSSFGYCT
ncbi:hypothetical protein DUI87_34699 [Hirundo rustica rustica]|uniref:Uncharacterized protein n=1 Tax=Hirundo rustica rustica TaxID=333673 RepID=A0A3M0IPU4_HIRRU|nr:hypothetical protein DUI87_34699 [Hirundo rustica rustica]